METIAVELTETRWEQWIGAAARLQRARALLDAARRPAPRATARHRTAGRHGSLAWMLAISLLGLWLL
jgi:hypothetical protein